MPIKSGTSHASVSLLSVIVAAMITGYMNVHATALTRLSVRVGTAINDWVQSPFEAKLVGMMAVLLALSFTWGVLFHLYRH